MNIIRKAGSKLCASRRSHSYMISHAVEVFFVCQVAFNVCKTVQ